MPYIVCCELAEVLCNVYEGFEDQLFAAPNKSQLAKWFRSESGYYEYIRFRGELGTDDYLVIVPRYEGFTFYFGLDHKRGDGVRLDWDQLFRHCRRQISSPSYRAS